ncbi:TonB family protein [Magnetospirillum sp. 15-1]|uniref:TonB family protein n=1 Tax=Magnetospirillum sp. 15-1 TaxID=1979370 RepID=UPI001482F250|nr:TonB family protein [Magnetospirillum sp. 15-1]
MPGRVARLSIVLLILLAAAPPAALAADHADRPPDRPLRHHALDREALRTYLEALRKRLQDNLAYPPEEKTAGIHGIVTIAFTITGNGDISPETLRVTKSSGVATLDAAAVSTALAASPLAPPPKEMSVELALAFLAPWRLPDGVSEKSVMSSGTGVFVDSTGMVLTARHVVENCKKIAVMKGRMLFPVLGSVMSPNSDLALLRLAVTVENPAIFEADDTLHDGEPVFFLGDNNLRAEGGDDHPKISNALVADNQTAASAREVFAINGTGMPGYSGSPVLNSNGRVIGLVLGKQSDRPKKGSMVDLIFTVRSATTASIKKFLGSAGVRYGTSNVSDQHAAAQQTVARRISVGIICR